MLHHKMWKKKHKSWIRCTASINFESLNEKMMMKNAKKNDLKAENICRPVARVATVIAVVWLHACYWLHIKCICPCLHKRARYEDREHKARAHDEQHSACSFLSFFLLFLLILLAVCLVVFPFIRFRSFSVLNVVMKHVVGLIDFINGSYFSIWALNDSKAKIIYRRASCKGRFRTLDHFDRILIDKVLKCINLIIWRKYQLSYFAISLLVRTYSPYTRWIRRNLQCFRSGMALFSPLLI